MNRSHTDKEAIECIELASKYFDIIMIGIYGIPGLTGDKFIY